MYRRHSLGHHRSENPLIGHAARCGSRGSEPSKIALQRAAPSDVERGAVEGTAERGVVQELAWNRLESPFLHRTHCSRMMRINDDALLVHFQHIHVEPFPA